MYHGEMGLNGKLHMASFSFCTNDFWHNDVFFQSAEYVSTLKILSSMPKILAKMKEKSVHFSTDPRICLKIRLK